MSYRGFRTLGDTEYVTRDGATALDTTVTHTRMMWFVLDSDMNDYCDLLDSHDSLVPGNHNMEELYLDADGVTLALSWADPSGFQAVTGSALSVGTWYHLCMVRNSRTDLRAYINGVQDIQITRDTTGSGVTDQNAIFSGYPGFSENAVNGRWFAYKDWNTNLSVAEIQKEMWTIRPSRTANLWSWSPAVGAALADVIKDFSGNGRHWTNSGALAAVQSNAQVPWGSSRRKSTKVVSNFGGGGLGWVGYIG